MKSLNNVQNICMRFVAAEASHPKANSKVCRYSCPVLVKGSYDISQFIIMIIISLARMKQSTANWHCTFKSPQIRPLSQTLSTRALLVRWQVSLAPLRAMEGFWRWIQQFQESGGGHCWTGLVTFDKPTTRTCHRGQIYQSPCKRCGVSGEVKKKTHNAENPDPNIFTNGDLKTFHANLCFQARNLNTYLAQSLGSWWQSSGKKYWTSCPLALSKICRIYSNFNN